MNDTIKNFDLDDPQLPQAIDQGAMLSGGYPYPEKLDDDVYEKTLYALHKQLVQAQYHIEGQGLRMVLIFEGRDAAGKGGAIGTYLEHLNPRRAYSVALPKPNDRESAQWYFQRYVDWLPAAGEQVLFDRSYYNRAGVERVMGFCTPEQTAHFLTQAPAFEKLLTDDGIRLFKFYLDIGQEMQLKRFHDRRHDPLKAWKLTSIDYKAPELWDAYSKARNEMLRATDSQHAPWTIIRANDKRRARLAVIQCVLHRLDYENKNPFALGSMDKNIVHGAADFLAGDKD